MEFFTAEKKNMSDTDERPRKKSHLVAANSTAVDTSSSSSSSIFDVRIHTLVPQPPTVGCVRIITTTSAVVVPPSSPVHKKDNTISLVVIADASGSMESGNRIDNLRAGIMRLGELSGQFASMNVELTVIRFSNEASIVWGPAPVPTEERLRQLCADIKPQGGTNMCKAVELALGVAEERSLAGKKSVHIVFFTDGADTSSLSTKLLQLENAQKEEEEAVNNNNNVVVVAASPTVTTTTTNFLNKLKSLKHLTFHCVGICSDADAQLLDKLARTACRGTFQCIKENNITKLIGCMWALMMEMIDDNVRLIVEAISGDDGVARAMVSRDVILRVCDDDTSSSSSSSCLVVGFKVPRHTSMLRARVVIMGNCMMDDDNNNHQQQYHHHNHRCLETSIDLPRRIAPAFDMVCAQEAVNQLQGELSEKIVALLRAGNPADAVLEVGITRQAIQALKEASVSSGGGGEDTDFFTAIIDEAMRELDTSEADMLRALDDFDEARDAELRAMSRCATVRNSGVSIIPNSRSLSALQRQLSE